MSEPSDIAKAAAVDYSHDARANRIQQAIDEAAAELLALNGKLSEQVAKYEQRAAMAEYAAEQKRIECMDLDRRLDAMHARAEKAEAELKEWESERAYLVKQLCRRGECSLIDSVEWRLAEHEKAEAANASMRADLNRIAVGTPSSNPFASAEHARQIAKQALSVEAGTDAVLADKTKD